MRKMSAARDSDEFSLFFSPIESELTVCVYNLIISMFQNCLGLFLFVRKANPSSFGFSACFALVVILHAAVIL